MAIANMARDISTQNVLEVKVETPNMSKNKPKCQEMGLCLYQGFWWFPHLNQIGRNAMCCFCFNSWICTLLTIIKIAH